MIWQTDLVKLLGVYKFHRGEILSYWVRPTTADVGIRAFGLNPNDLVSELTIGMQSILLDGDQDINSLTRKVARWEVSHPGDLDILVKSLYKDKIRLKFIDNLCDIKIL